MKIASMGGPVPPKGHRSRRLVLVINDTQEILELFSDIFTEEGYDVIVSSFAPKELDEIIAIDPDLLVVDFMIGDEARGWQLLQKLKMHRETATIPAIACTAAVAVVRELEGHLSAKNIAVVLKPFDIDDLLRAVDHVFSIHTAHDELRSSDD